MLTRIYLLLFLIPQVVLSQSTTYTDGPYLLQEDGGWILKWMDQNELYSTPYQGEPVPELEQALPGVFAAEYVPLNPEFKPLTQAHYSGVSKITALSDLHGQYDLSCQLLQANGVLDAENNWSYGNGHLVVVGDLFDRGPQVIELLWLFHRLEQQAAAAGGQVHVLLGNHEALVLEGDLRYIHRKYRYTTAVLGQAYEQLVGPTSYLGQWLRTKPIAISINDIAFVHAGLSPTLMKRIQSFSEMNRTFQQSLLDADLDEALQDTLLNLLYLDEGPLWYRGYFDEDNGASKRELKSILHQIDCDRIVVGHTPHDTVVARYGRRVFGVDSNIQKGTYGELLIWENDQFYRAFLDGKRILIE